MHFNVNKEIENNKLLPQMEEAASWDVLEFYNAVMNDSILGITVVDINHRIILTNPTFCKLFNKSTEEFVGKYCYNEFEKRNEVCPHCPGLKAIATGAPAEVETEAVLDDGTRIYVRNRAIPLFSQNGKIKGFIEMIENIDEKKRAELKLKQNEEHLKMLFNSILAGVIMIDTQTHEIIDCNLQAEKMIGLQKKEIIGKVCHKFICPAEMGKCPINDLHQSVDMSERVLLKAGNIRIPILKTVTPINCNNHSYLIESFIDISELKNAEKALWTSEERFRTAAKLASDLIWELNIKTGHLIWFGDIDGKLGYNKGEFPRTLQAWESIIHPDDYSKVVYEKEEHIKEIKPYNIEYRVRKKNGDYLYWTDFGTTLLDKEGKPDRMIGVCSDVTNRRVSEQKQLKLLEQLEKVNDELRSFAYIVSHDLKAPLRGVKVLADWLSADYSDKLGPEGKNQVELLVSRVDRMQNLINGILQYSRIGRVDEIISEIDTGEVVANVIDAILPPENIKILVQENMPIVVYEKTRIFQVFQNLISNAIKYMDKEEGIIKINFIEHDDFWQFSVIDNGPGIKEEYFEKIFQMFQTLSPRDQFESTGVGLTVVKKIVELYGGRIWVESQIEDGSTFLFTIPKYKLEDKRATNEELQANIIS